MMTIKHITLGGEEFIYPTTHVNYVTASGLTSDNVKDAVWRYDNDGRAHALHDGTIFVMNEHGKTVSRYDLGTSMVPIDARNPPIPGTQRA